MKNVLVVYYAVNENYERIIGNTNAQIFENQTIETIREIENCIKEANKFRQVCILNIIDLESEVTEG